MLFVHFSPILSLSPFLYLLSLLASHFVFSSSLLSWLSCDAIFAFLQFIFKARLPLAASQPLLSVKKTSAICYVQCCCFLFLEKSNREVYSASIFSSSFEQRYFFLGFPSETDLKQAQPLALNWTLKAVIGSGFSVQTCNNLICWPFAFLPHFLKTFNHGQPFYLQECSVPWGMLSSLNTSKQNQMNMIK